MSQNIELPNPLAPAPAPAPVPVAVKVEVANTEPDKFGELLVLANQGDAKAQERIRRHVKANPGIFKGDFGEFAKQSWVGLCANGDFMLTESLLQQVETLQVELAGEKPPPAIRLLAEQSALAWLRAHFYEVQLSTGHHAKLSPNKITELQALQMRAQQHYTGTLKELEKVRQLLARAVPPKPVAKVASPKRPRTRRSAPVRSRMLVNA